MKIEDIRKAQFIFEGKYKRIAFWTNPFYFVRLHLYEAIKDYAPKLGGVVMDFGCGAKPYKSLFKSCTKYVGVDISTSGHDHSNEDVDIFYDGKHIPFEDEYFDNVFSSEVFEHIARPEDILSEIRRVLKKGGYLLVTVPFVWNEHEIPYDYKRYTSFGIKNLLESSGFEFVEQKKSTNYIEMIYQMKAEYYRYIFAKRSPRFRHFIQRTLITFQTFKGVVMSRVLPDNDSFYGDNIILCRKK
ncbi:methylase involved in ubiquinone/menaquinone biosynthesis [Lachnospiraceae bacterium JC7]|nr:methylase involved in ubiquinone/menaquinone biosynthesis [Lachnospiraceae bacterium JC7]